MDGLREVIPKIISTLEPLNPYKIILFGSLTKKNRNQGNDIDIAVILDSNSLPSSFEERMENAILVEEYLFDLSLIYPIDITVYTKKEYEKLKEQKKSFIAELNLGETIYDRAS
ncbi:nucleotidyltransferase domain-containing protein [Spirochaeta lutea]|uniref:Polymerase beta nucleotidyltransferase domain-containing protein n=1 Tax=Spirochaeta lutea TaxID=1480694 RepID=A0A098QZZ1_9SPIO|nr:nucleotidyltransferase domain-containing protein [Spirochaeta lutea]KGE73445.1 hypothetical protein DC28_03610 [Spirochaeta lutea]